MLYLHAHPQLWFDKLSPLRYNGRSSFPLIHSGAVVCQFVFWLTRELILCRQNINSTFADIINAAPNCIGQNSTSGPSVNDLEPLTADRFLPLFHPRNRRLNPPRPHSFAPDLNVRRTASKHSARYNFGTLLGQQPQGTIVHFLFCDSAPASQAGISPVSLLS